MTKTNKICIPPLRGSSEPLMVEFHCEMCGNTFQASIETIMVGMPITTCPICLSGIRMEELEPTKVTEIKACEKLFHKRAARRAVIRRIIDILHASDLVGERLAWQDKYASPIFNVGYKLQDLLELKRKIDMFASSTAYLNPGYGTEIEEDVAKILHGIDFDNDVEDLPLGMTNMLLSLGSNSFDSYQYASSRGIRPEFLWRTPIPFNRTIYQPAPRVPINPWGNPKPNECDDIPEDGAEAKAEDE